jgi:hypothetical protein
MKYVTLVLPRYRKASLCGQLSLVGPTGEGFFGAACGGTDFICGGGVGIGGTDQENGGTSCESPPDDGGGDDGEL